MASRQPNSRTATNQVLGSGIGLTILGFVASFFELEQASRVLTGSLFDRWALLFILGFTGTLLVAAATWRSRKALISREDQRSAMKTNALEIAAFIVVAIAVLAGRVLTMTRHMFLGRMFHRGLAGSQPWSSARQAQGLSLLERG